MTVYNKVCLTLTNFHPSVSIEYDDGCCSGVVFKNMWSKKLNTTLVLFKIDEVRTKFHISQEVNEKVTSSLMLPISSMKLFIAMILEILIQSHLHFILAGNADNGMDYVMGGIVSAPSKISGLKKNLALSRHYRNNEHF